MKKIIHWQPEMAQSIIYWSFTFFVLFLSLIMSLENTRPYWKSNLVMGLFFICLFLGLRRSFVLKQDSIKIRYTLFWKDKEVPIEQIKSFQSEKYGITIYIDRDKEPVKYLMKKKARKIFLDYLTEMDASKEQLISEKQVTGEKK
ncbi:hypothetical protein A5844_000145 [Enterococcus sp. 10A9_DIV0425]|uniref:EbsA protein n=1 Tax=Candidatus Enterococcus wittei TaxID=1987383 RepID=A0A2C9XP24_9ENTE|nr:EbsA family protein [Enterococcus sp. 10A9_DIV0425]OTP11930.1 hypothetical protein A5844_000145 [Enterococcus sp. 10A9_DIV0425]